jgi:RNA polymerase sigma factor (sigma-70 family)
VRVARMSPEAEIPDLLLRLRPQIESIGGRQSGEDLFQEVYLKFLRSSLPWPATRGFILKTSRNLLTDIRRREVRRRHHTLDQARYAHGPDRETEDAVEAQEEQRLVRDALNRLPPRSREILLAQHDLEERARDTAVRLGITVRAVRDLRSRANVLFKSMYRVSARRA